MDVAAGSLMFDEVGGRCDDLDGGPVNLGSGVSNVLATNAGIDDELSALVRRIDTER